MFDYCIKLFEEDQVHLTMRDECCKFTEKHFKATNIPFNMLCLGFIPCYANVMVNISSWMQPWCNEIECNGRVIRLRMLECCSRTGVPTAPAAAVSTPDLSGNRWSLPLLVMFTRRSGLCLMGVVSSWCNAVQYAMITIYHPQVRTRSAALIWNNGGWTGFGEPEPLMLLTPRVAPLSHWIRDTHCIFQT